MTLLQSAPVRLRPAPLLDLATWAAHGDRVAVRTADEAITYAELAARAADLAERVLGTTRRLVVVEGANDLTSLVAYLAAVEHGHVALLVPDGRPDQRDALVASYDADVVLHADGTATVRREGSAHALHPDLALLLSTSGSTGSPKLVRLSRDNLRSNAASIATYLGLTPDDRAATSLPLHYCYGLSVVNSHLVTGAGLVLTDLSVVDECFWDLVRTTGATSFAGVPYTFDLLDRSGFAARDLPSLRYVTQAGGRMAPDVVRRYADLGRERGWDLVVMYGQTEATARMAWLPPDLAQTHPEAIGVPVPGGAFRIDRVPEAAADGVGELVYLGPNVMMGYAEEPADLALPGSLTELRTGDLARVVDGTDGVYEVVGRRNRHAKVFGLRLDLDRVEREVGEASGAPVRCVAFGDALHAFTTRPRATTRVREAVAASCGLPRGAVRVHELVAFPATANGKPDHGALVHQARLAEDAGVDDDAPAVRRVTPATVRDELALVLGRPDARVGDSFVDLGGDSLSYVELATRLGRLLGDLPAGWHLLSATDLAARARGPRRGTLVDTTVALRALAIVLIVGTHANLLTIVGGAHVLLAVAGFNLARFQLADLPRATRVRHALGSVAQVVVPSTLFIGGVALVSGMYDPATAFFLNGVLGSDTWDVQWQFWFLESLVWLTLAATALVALPWADQLERRAPYAFALGLLGATLALRYAWTGVEAGPTERYTVGVVAWFVTLGWAAARARTLPQRLLVIAVTAAGIAGYFGDPQREVLVLAGVAVLVLVPVVRLPRMVATAAGVLAGASLSIYLTHWQVYPYLEMDHPFVATVLSLAVGIAYARLMTCGRRRCTPATRIRGALRSRSSS